MGENTSNGLRSARNGWSLKNQKEITRETRIYAIFITKSFESGGIFCDDDDAMLVNEHIAKKR